MTYPRPVDDRFSVDGLSADVKGFTLTSKMDLDASRFVGPFDSKAYGPRTTTFTGSMWPAGDWSGNDFQMVMREPVVLPWYRALWHRLRHIPVPTVVAVRFVGTPTRQTISDTDDGALETSLEFKARDVEFFVVPDYSWRRKAFVAWLRFAALWQR